MAIAFLADENCPIDVVRALRRAGYDVARVQEVAPRAPDSAILALATAESRIIITRDSDFPELARRAQCSGVVFIRFKDQRNWSARADALVAAIAGREEEILGAITIVEAAGVRAERIS